MTTATKSASKTTPVSATKALQSPIVVTEVEKGKVITGNVGRDEFIKFATVGKNLLRCQFSIGVNDQDTDECNWHNIVVFGETAEKFRAKCGQGDLIRVKGTLRAKEFTSKAGLSAVYFETSAYELKVIAKAQTQEAVVEAEVVADNIPF